MNAESVDVPVLDENLCGMESNPDLNAEFLGLFGEFQTASHTV